MSVLFLFGAGASFGNPDCEPYPPPVGAKLFPDIKGESKVSSEFDPDVLEALNDGDFEGGMELLWDKNPALIIPFQIELAKYFTKFKAGKDNYYSELLRIIKKSKKTAVFSTTNYDLLLEQCINDNNYLISYCGLPVKKDNIPLLKIHGSCNFLPDIKPDQIQGIGFIVPKEGGASAIGAQIKPASAEETKAFCDKSDSIAPAIAVYSKGKQVLTSGSFVKEQQEQWKKEVKNASKIFVIGLKVIEHDDHIWDVLASNNTWLGYVGLGSDSANFMEWSSKKERKNSFVLSHTFQESLPIIAKRLKS
jgi:hypothetical protein